MNYIEPQAVSAADREKEREIVERNSAAIANALILSMEALAAVEDLTVTNDEWIAMRAKALEAIKAVGAAVEA